MEKERKEARRILIFSLIMVAFYYFAITTIGEVFDIPDFKATRISATGTRMVWNKTPNGLTALLSLLTALIYKKVKKHKQEKV